MRYDIIVLGGGIIGCATAWELAQRGQRVCLIERGTIGCEASTAAAGILSAQMDLEGPGAFLELCQASRRLYPRWVDELERRSRMSVDYHVDGILSVAFTDDEVRRMDHRQRWQRRLGLKVERWSPREILHEEPNLAGKFKAGFFFPTEAQVDNVKLMEALGLACRKAGVAVLEQTEAKRLVIRRRHVAGVQTGRGTLFAPVVVNCLGSWSSLNRVPALRVPVEPAKGQMLAFTAPKRLFRHIVMSEAAYEVQRRSGVLIVGSTVEFVGFDKRVTLEGIHQILFGFRRMVSPSVFTQCAFQEAWAGFRPFSQDRLPILGETRVGGLLIASGHFRHGILLAPITAKLVADLMLRGRASHDLSSFSPSRFE